MIQQLCILKKRWVSPNRCTHHLTQWLQKYTILSAMEKLRTIFVENQTTELTQ